MLSMEPSIKRGLTFWDRALMPKDEFEERIRSVRAEMRKAGLDALVVAGNMYEDADLLWFTAGPVDGILVLTLDGEPAIFTNSGSRESFFLRELTFIDDLSYRGPLMGKAVREALAARGVVSGRLGTAGLQVLMSRPYHDLVEALADYKLQDFSTVTAALRMALRPRERIALRIALGMAEKAAVAAEAVFASGGTTAAAMIEAEHIARRAGAWDVRVLANLDAGAGDVAKAGLACLSATAQQSALRYGLGTGIGIELHGNPMIRPDSDAVLVAGTLLSLRIFADGATPSFTSAIVEVGMDGATEVEPLARVLP